MRNAQHDKMKNPAQLSKDMGKTCSIPGCDKPLTHMDGPGSDSLCREHQLYQREYGGMGRLDRPHTFHRTWVCSECGTNVLEDHRLADIEDEMTKRRVARILMHGDHHGERRADGGDDTAENIKSLCFVCHAKKTVLNEDYKR
jgi:5-methylcytosine-specific restriction endonuclease McrA